MREPTKAQAQLIQYFADGTKPTMRTNRQTYARCEAEGWIAQTDEWPYHEATDKGREAIGFPKKKRSTLNSSLSLTTTALDSLRSVVSWRSTEMSSLSRRMSRSACRRNTRCSTV